MKFIFPQNYTFNTKFLGIIDYSSIFLNFIWWLIIFIITKIFNFKLLLTIIFFIITCLPILLISLFGVNQENIVYIMKYVFIFFKKPKIYLYKK